MRRRGEEGGEPKAAGIIIGGRVLIYLIICRYCRADFTYDYNVFPHANHRSPEFHQRKIYEVNGKFPTWNGTAWRSYVKNRIYNKNLNMSCVDCDWGVGVIKFGNQKLFKAEKNLNYAFLKNNRRKLLNLVSVKGFIKKFN